MTDSLSVKPFYNNFMHETFGILCYQNFDIYYFRDSSLVRFLHPPSCLSRTLFFINERYAIILSAYFINGNELTTVFHVKIIPFLSGKIITVNPHKKTQLIC